MKTYTPILILLGYGIVIFIFLSSLVDYLFTYSKHSAVMILLIILFVMPLLNIFAKTLIEDFNNTNKSIHYTVDKDGNINMSEEDKVLLKSISILIENKEKK